MVTTDPETSQDRFRSFYLNAADWVEIEQVVLKLFQSYCYESADHLGGTLYSWLYKFWKSCLHKKPISEISFSQDQDVDVKPDKKGEN